MLAFHRSARAPLSRLSGLLFFAAATAALVAGCTPSIGDKCVLSTDCSVRGDRLCDTSQPDGYCTVNCQGDGCPDKAACVLFNGSIPGCGFDDRAGGRGSRVARSFCSARCYSNSDCRPGYVCADPRQPPWNALILDDDQTQLACLVIPPGGIDAGMSTSTNVCGPGSSPPAAIDASPASIDNDGGTLPPLVPTGDAGDAGDASDAADASDSG